MHALGIGLLLVMIVSLLATAWTYWAGRRPVLMLASFAAATVFIATWFRTLTRTATTAWPGSTGVFLALALAILGVCVVVVRRSLAALSSPRDRGAGLPVALTVAALALVPSLVVIEVAVPPVQIAHHLRVAWTGLDVFELVALAGTAMAIRRRSRLAIVSGTVAGALLLCDAWINVVPTTAAARLGGIGMAFLEVPLAVVSFWVAVRVTSRAATGTPGALTGWPGPSPRHRVSAPT